jgi:hypothetical protein
VLEIGIHDSSHQQPANHSPVEADHDTIDIWITSKQVAWKIHASMILMHGTMAGFSTCSKQNRAEQRRGTFQNGLSAWLFLDMPITHEILIITSGLARVQRAYLHVKSIK